MITDYLTGAHTRAELKPWLRQELDRALRENLSLSLLIIDVDHFKSINDGFGHSRGDKVLSELALRIADTTREKDLLFRYGGDEFVLLLPDTPRDKASVMAGRLVSVIGQTPFEGEPPISVSASIGQVTFPADAQTAEELFEEADLRLYEAKRRGRGRSVGEKPRTRIKLGFEAKTRLIEREEAGRVLGEFLKAIEDRTRGILAVTGPRGSGRSRFLTQISQRARMNGFGVIDIKPKPATKQKPGFALAQALRQKKADIPNNQKGLLEVFDELTGKEPKILITIDDVGLLDFATLSVIRRLLASEGERIIAVAYTVKNKSSPRVFFQGPVQETIELSPLSRQGLKVWLRTLMAWEPDEDFITWLYFQTSGLPGLVKKGLEYLLRREILVRNNGDWIIAEDYVSFKLASHLASVTEPRIQNIPQQPTNFVGREEEIERGKELLESNRLVTIQGPGGIGKTRLGLQIAAEVSGNFADGVFFTPLVSVHSTDFLVPALADAVGLSFYASKPPLEQLADFLGGKEILILLDGFEHLIQDAGVVANLLRSASGLRFLVTSREVLNLQAEAILELGPMDVPAPGISPDIQTSSAAQLFVENARWVKPGLVISGEETSCIARICRLVEGVPLGIELAASWVRSLSVGEIAAEIERGYDFLISSMRDLPARHRSLRVVFDYSWELLQSKEREVFRKLSDFEAGFSRKAAESTADASLALLALFIDKSLISRGPSGRYHMLELIRKYAEEKLGDNREEYLQTKDLHAAYFGSFLAEREDDLVGARQSQALKEIKEEIENLRAGFRWAVEQRDLNTTAGYLGSLSLFYEYQGRFAEGAELFSRADQELEEIEGLIPAQVKALKGTFLYRLGSSKEAKELLESSLVVFRKLGVKRDTAAALQTLGNIAYRWGEYQDSRRLFSKSLSLYREICDQPGIGSSLAGMASIAAKQGKYHEAMKRSYESLEVLGRIGNHRVLAKVLNNLGNIHVAMGSHEQALECYAESLDMYKELGHKWGIEIVLGNMSEAALYNEEYYKARQLLSEALAIAKEVGDQEGIVFSLNNLGDAAFGLSQLSTAREFYQQALGVSKGTAYLLGTARALNGLGKIACEAGEYAESRDYLRQALKTLVQSKQAQVQSEVLTSAAMLLLKQAEHLRAAALLSVISANPATEKKTRTEALRLLSELKAKLAPEEFQAAVKEAQARKLEQVVKELLARW